MMRRQSRWEAQGRGRLRADDTLSFACAESEGPAVCLPRVSSKELEARCWLQRLGSLQVGGLEALLTQCFTLLAQTLTMWPLPLFS